MVAYTQPGENTVRAFEGLTWNQNNLFGVETKVEIGE